MVFSVFRKLGTLMILLSLGSSSHAMEKYSATQALIEAVKDKDLAAAKVALAQGGDARATITIEDGKRVERLLMFAAEQGDLPMVQLLRQHCEEGNLSRDLLTGAIKSGNFALVQWVVAQAFDEHQKVLHEFGLKPLIVYIISPRLGEGETEESRISLMEFALEDGSDVNMSLYEGLSSRPILILLERGNNKMVRWLVEHGATITPEEARRLKEQPSIFENPLLNAIAFGQTKQAIDLIQRLIRRIRLNGDECKLIRDALVLASAQGNRDVVRAILGEFRDIYYDSTIGRALERAAINGHLNVIETLYENRAENIEHNAQMWAPFLSRAFFLAVVQGRSAVVHYLLDKDFLYNLGIPLDQAGRRVRMLLENPDLTAKIRKELSELLDLLVSYQKARRAGQIIAGRAQLAPESVSLFRLLPQEVIQNIVGYLAHAPAAPSGQ